MQAKASRLSVAGTKWQHAPASLFLSRTTLPPCSVTWDNGTPTSTRYKPAWRAEPQWGDVAQALDDISCLVEPSHMGVAGGEPAIGDRKGRGLLDRQE